MKQSLFGGTTGPAKDPTAQGDGGEGAAPLAIVIAVSDSQPQREGEIGLLPVGQAVFLGRGDERVEEFVYFVRHRPGEVPAVDPRDGVLAGESLSRRQLRIRSTGDAVQVEKIGRCRTFINGEECEGGTLHDGDTILLEGELLLVCVARPSRLPRPLPERPLHPFGEPDEDGIVGESPGAWLWREQIARVASWDNHGLIRGESGTGKEMTAAAIHKRSKRAGGPLLARNASGFTPSILPTELFGVIKNYPNPGTPERQGLIPAADGGTIFLDEIGDLPREVQVLLLRALQSGEIQVVGETSTRRVNVRLLGATNRVDDHVIFRSDFTARMPARVNIPPLRQRREDIPLLIRHLLLERAQSYPEVRRFLREGPDRRMYPRISFRFVDYLVRHPLPTNMRELDDILMHAVAATIKSGGDKIHAPEGVTMSPPRASAPPAPAPARKRAPSGYIPPGSPTREEVVAALEEAGGNVSRAAENLGRNRTALYRLIEAYGITVGGRG